jgi:hypothetical protein
LYFYTIYTTSFYVYYVPPPPPPPPPQTAPFSERTVTLTLAETCAMVRDHPYHYALIKNSLTEYGLVYHLRLSKKKSTGGNDFFPKVLRPEKRK